MCSESQSQRLCWEWQQQRHKERIAYPSHLNPYIWLSKFGCLFLAIWLEAKRRNLAAQLLPTLKNGPIPSPLLIKFNTTEWWEWWDHFSCVAYNIVWKSCETHVFNSTQTQIALKVCFNKTSKQKVRSEYYVMLLLFSLWFWLTEWMNGGRREKWKVLSKKKRLAVNCKLNMGEIIFNTLFPLLHFSWAWDTSECERWLISRVPIPYLFLRFVLILREQILEK